MNISIKLLLLETRISFVPLEEGELSQILQKAVLTKILVAFHSLICPAFSHLKCSYNYSHVCEGTEARLKDVFIVTLGNMGS